MTISAVLIDSREPESIQKLSFGNAPKMITALDYGDCWATVGTDIICIERKTPSDLLGSIKDNRLFGQVAGMRQRSPWTYLVVTGVLTSTVGGMVVADSRVTGWTWESLQGALLSVQELGANIVYCESDNEYEATVLRLCNRERSKEKVLEPLTHSRIMSPAEVMLTSLPGIGFERAQLMLREFDGNAAQALAWLTWKDTISQIAGIGDGIKRSVRTALQLAEDETLVIATPDGYGLERGNK